MSFASLTFLYFFLPLVLLGYYLLPNGLRNGFLLLANLVFYAWGEPSFLFVILLTTIVNFCAAKWMVKRPEGKKMWAAAAIAIDLLLLLVFKYAAFVVDTLRPLFFWTELPHLDITLPLGISFYTFQVLSYIIDVYRADVQPEKGFVRFATYMTLFPQLIAGPIIRYRDLADQLGVRRQNLQRFADGVRLLLIGLSKKILLANPMGALWEGLQAAPAENGLLGAWLGALAFTLQIYLDFSAYSDMARGLGKLFGFEIPINFDYPYISRSITEFWRRWHISLGTWFRDYVYFPLGGSRASRGRTVRNLLVVWALTGLWHGASWNFVLWGLYYFALLVLEKLWLGRILSRCPGWVCHVYAMFFVVVGWVLFAFDGFDGLGGYLYAMFCPADGLIGEHARVLALTYAPLVCVSILACLPLGKKLAGRWKQKVAWPVAECLLCGGAVLLCTASLVAQSYNPFLYFRF